MQSLSKAKLKLFTSLQAKKFRFRHHIFLAEGKKMVIEAQKSGWGIEALVFDEKHQIANEQFSAQVPADRCFLASTKDFNSLSSLSTPEGVLAVVEMPTHLSANEFDSHQLPPGKGLLLERIQDPGNLGTLIRTADWFGINYVLCSSGTADWSNPKTLRSSMGSIFRMQLSYAENWQEVLKTNKDRIWVADMNGEAAESAVFDSDSWILLGNEANGPSQETRSIEGMKRISLSGSGGAESLNVGVAGGILAYLLSK